MLWHLRGLHSIKPIHYIFSMKQSTIFAIAAALFASTSAVAQVSYPPAQKGTTVDEYFGEKVADPYRWLEDDMSQQTADWVKAENAVTR